MLHNPQAKVVMLMLDNDSTPRFRDSTQPIMTASQPDNKSDFGGDTFRSAIYYLSTAPLPKFFADIFNINSM